MNRVGVSQQNAIVRVALTVFQGLQGGDRLRPRVKKGRSWMFDLDPPRSGRSRTSEEAEIRFTIHLRCRPAS